MSNHRRASRWRAVVTALVGCVAVLTLSASATAQDRSAGADIRSGGVSGAVRARAEGVAALHMNPAGLSQVRVSETQVGYTYRQLQLGPRPFYDDLPDANLHTIAVNVAEGRLHDAFAAGVGYAYQRLDSELGSATAHHVRAALASGFEVGSVGVHGGVGARYGHQGGLDNDDALDVDVGVAVALFEVAFVGVVGHDLADSAEGTRRLGVGAAADLASLVFEVDVVIPLADDANIQWGGGVARTFVDAVPVRIGYLHVLDADDDALDEHWLSTSVGWQGDIAAIDVGYRQGLHDSDAIELGLELRLFAP